MHGVAVFVAKQRGKAGHLQAKAPLVVQLAAPLVLQARLGHGSEIWPEGVSRKHRARNRASPHEGPHGSRPGEAMVGRERSQPERGSRHVPRQQTCFGGGCEKAMLVPDLGQMRPGLVVISGEKLVSA